jgi:hypothetical protein
MEPFVQSSSQSSGTAALDTLFAPGSPSTPASPSSPSRPTSEEAAPRASEPGEHGKLGDLPGETPEGSTATPEAAGAPESAPNYFEFNATDASGKRKVRVDLNDKEALARILPQAYGMRKMQAERDTLKSELAKVQPRAAELEANWNTLERTYAENGVEGLVDLLGGKAGHFKDWKAKEFEKESRYANASEMERQNMELTEKLSRIEREAVAREKRVAAETAAATTKQEAAQLQSLENQITPAFNKNRFAGTLGDAAREEFLDQAIWDRSIKNLEKLPDDVDLTPALIEREFRASAAMVKATIGKQVSVQTKQVLDKKRAAAQVQVAAAATKSVRPASIEQSMAANIRKGGVGGLTDALMDVFRSK